MLLKLIKKITLSSIICILLSATKPVYAQNFDINKDGIINSKDLDVLSNFLWSDEEEYDLNKDGLVDTVDLAILAKQVNSDNSNEGIFTVYKNSSILGTFLKNNLLDAISLASKSGGIVKSNENLIWDNENYFIYSNNDLMSKTKTIHEATKIANDMNNSLVTSKNGNSIYDKNSNYRKIIGVTRTNVNLRSEPQMNARTDIMIPDGTLVEVDSIENGFYNVLYYDNEKKLHTGYVPNYLDIIQDDINNSQLGYISAREESNGNPGAVGLNPNDKGGASFGIWQLSSKMGTVDEFLNYIKDLNPEIHSILTNAKKQDKDKFEENFINKWKEIAKTHYDEFYELQRSFIKKNYFDAFIKLAKKNNLNINSLLEFNSTSNMIWSTSVQHGINGTLNILKKIPLVLNLEDIIIKLYQERLNIISRSYPPNSPNPGVVSLYNGIKNRLENEQNEILRILRRELSY